MGRKKRLEAEGEKEKGAQYYTAASEKLTAGKIEDSIASSAQGDRAREVYSQMLVRADNLENQLPQALINVLRSFGASEDLPVEILNEVYQDWMARTASVEEPESIVAEVEAEKPTVKVKEREISLTPRSYQSARLLFRLTDDLSKPARVKDVALEIVGDEIAREGGDFQKVYFRLSANYFNARSRIDRVMELINPENPKDVSFPVGQDLLDSFLYSSVIDENVYDIFTRLNNIPAYAGLSYKQILDFLHENRFKSVNLSGSDPVEAVDVVEEEEVVGKWTDSEKWYFACKLNMKQPWVNKKDRTRLQEILDKYDKQVRGDLEYWEKVKNRLYTRLRSFLQMSQAEKNDAWNLEDDDTKFLLAVLSRGNIDLSSIDVLLA